MIDYLWPLWRWLDPRWWSYLTQGRADWRRLWCRVRGHPYPVWFYNPGGLEPDMRCKNCYEDLG